MIVHVVDRHGTTRCDMNTNRMPRDHAWIYRTHEQEWANQPTTWCQDCRPTQTTLEL